MRITTMAVLACLAILALPMQSRAEVDTYTVSRDSTRIRLAMTMRKGFRTHHMESRGGLPSGRVVLDRTNLAGTRADIRLDARTIKVQPADATENAPPEASRSSSRPAPLKTDEYPFIDYRLRALKNVNSTPGGFTATAVGFLKINGIEQEVTSNVTGTFDRRRLMVDGLLPIKLSAFGIRPPSMLGLVRITDEATVHIHIVSEKPVEAGR